MVLEGPTCTQSCTQKVHLGSRVYVSRSTGDIFFKASTVSSPLTINGRQASLGLERGGFPYIPQCQMTIESLLCIPHLLRKLAYEMASGENLAKQSIYLMSIRMLGHIGNEGPEGADS